jgi:hypothetical protein
LHLVAEAIEDDNAPTDKDLLALFEEIDAKLGEAPVKIDAEFFTNPRGLPLLEELKSPFAHWLRFNMKLSEPESECVANRFPAYFVLALNHEWGRGLGEYQPLVENLKTPFTEADAIERDWFRYRAHLEAQANAPVFDESFGLRDVYIPLRAAVAVESGEKRGASRADADEGPKSRSHRLVDLKAEVLGWIRGVTVDRDDIRVICGGLGCGKSTFGTMLSADLAAAGDMRVVFVRLHELVLSGDLGRSISQLMENAAHFRHDLFAQDELNQDLLLVLDGLDEYTEQTDAKEAVENFLFHLRTALGQYNSGGVRVRVILSGRNNVIDPNKFGGEAQVLHVMPYLISKEERDRLKFVKSEIDPEFDQRPDWWRRYGLTRNETIDEMPSELNTENLTEITSQPLLNYLVALSHTRKQLKFGEATTRNEIYADLIDAVHERKWGGRKGAGKQFTGDLSKTEFESLLQEIALAAWHGKQRTVTVGEIEEYCGRRPGTDLRVHA